MLIVCSPLLLSHVSPGHSETPQATEVLLVHCARDVGGGGAVPWTDSGLNEGQRPPDSILAGEAGNPPRSTELN